MTDVLDPLRRRYTNMFGGYRCDFDLMLQQLAIARDSFFVESARWPCIVLLHPADACEVSRRLEEHSVLNYANQWVTRILGMVVVENLHLGPGIASIERCPDCSPYDMTCRYKAVEALCG